MIDVRILILMNLLILFGTAPSDISFFDDQYMLAGMPPYMKEINSVTVLADSLKSPDLSTRLHAVIRLVQLKDHAAVPAIVDAYQKEPVQTVSAVDLGYGFKYFALSGIGRIGGEVAASFLRHVADSLMSSVKDKQNLGPDESSAVAGLLEGLAELEPADRANKYLEYFNYEKMNSWARVDAYVAFERIHLRDTTFATYKDSLFYLLDQKRNLKVTENYIAPRVMSTQYAKANALSDLIVAYGAQDLSVFDQYGNTLEAADPFLNEIAQQKLTITTGIKNREQYGPFELDK
jgi:hypothetical protein